MKKLQDKLCEAITKDMQIKNIPVISLGKSGNEYGKKGSSIQKLLQANKNGRLYECMDKTIIELCEQFGIDYAENDSLIYKPDIESLKMQIKSTEVLYYKEIASAIGVPASRLKNYLLEKGLEHLKKIM